MSMRHCNSDCVFYKEIRQLDKGTIGKCDLFLILVKKQAECHNEEEANKQEKLLKETKDDG